MKCSHIQSVLSEYLDGQLSHVQSSQVERHLLSCDECQGRWRMLRRTVRLVGHLGHEKCPVDLRATVAQATQARPAPSPWRSSVPAAAASGIAAGVVCLLLTAHLMRPTFGNGGLPARLAGANPAVVMEAVDAPVHDQYDLAAGMGSVDGLLLALPPERGHARRLNKEAELRPRTNKSN
jgi:anti-sigma factor RsiW